MNKVTETAPERIWIQVSDNKSDNYEAFPAPNEDMTWCQDSTLACEVEYVRADLHMNYQTRRVKQLEHIAELAAASVQNPAWLECATRTWLLEQALIKYGLIEG